MIDRADITKSPAMRGPRERLSPTLARGRSRDISHERRPVPPIEAVTVRRADVAGMAQRPVTISLSRVKFLERPDP